MSVAALATPTQESVWWVHQRSHNKSLYNLTWRLACDRDVDFRALGIAWQAVVDRHDALRMSVVRNGDAIELIVRPHAEAELGLVEFDAPDFARLLAEECQERETDLGGASLARLVLVRAGADVELVLTVHHAVLDGWGMRLVLADLSTAYAAALAGRDPEFGEPPSFLDYAAEQAAAAADGYWRPGVEHWRATLEGAAAATLVPDRDVPFVVGAPGTTLRYSFGAAAAAGIRALSQAAYATPFAAVLAALDIVLARGGAGDDVTIGIAAANRMSVHDQQLVGYTANLCISRTAVEETDTIGDVVGRCRDGIWAMLAHQGVPYPAVFGALSPETQRGLTDAAPVLLSYLGPIVEDLRLGDVELTLLRTPNRAARADLAMSVWDSGDGFAAEVEYNTARFDERTIVQALDDMGSVLAAGADRTVGSLAVRTRARRGGSAPPPRADLPAGDLWHRVSAAWAELVGDPPSGPDTDFFAAGGHSMSVVRLAAALESETGVELDVVDWLAEPTPRRMVALLEGTNGAGPHASTLVVARDGAGPHLHLVHGAGGGVQDYRALVDALPGDWRVTISHEREPLDTIAAMAERYRADLDAAGLRPDIVGGWSMGGQVAFELARGGGTMGLVVIDSRPPVALEGDFGELRLAGFEAAVLRSFGAEPGPEVTGGVELRLGALAAHLGEVSAADLTARWRTYERHARAAASHVARGRIDVPALLVAADLLDVQLDQWAALVGDSRRLRVDTDHHGVLLAADELAAAIAAGIPGVA